MAEQVRVPGTELEELRDLLRRVAAFVDDETKVDVLDEAVVDPSAITARARRRGRARPRAPR